MGPRFWSIRGRLLFEPDLYSNKYGICNLMHILWYYKNVNASNQDNVEIKSTTNIMVGHFSAKEAFAISSGVVCET